MKTYNITNISGLKLAINCETQQTAKKVLETFQNFDFPIPSEWAASRPVLIVDLSVGGFTKFDTFHYAKERNYRIITDVIFLLDNEVVKSKFDNVLEVVAGIDWISLNDQKNNLYWLVTEFEAAIPGLKYTSIANLISLLNEIEAAAQKDKALSDWTQIETAHE